MSLEALAGDFVQKTLPKASWTHDAHLRVGLWHLLRHTPEETLHLLRQRIRAYNLATGGENTDTAGYHETITRFYVWLIQAFLDTQALPGSPDELAEQLVADCGDKTLPFRFWSKEVLFSIPARLGWVPPDLRELSWQGQVGWDPGSTPMT